MRSRADLEGVYNTKFLIRVVKLVITTFEGKLLSNLIDAVVLYS